MKVKYCTVVSEKVERTFEKFGQFIGRNPWRVIILVVFVTVGIGMGLFWSDTDTYISEEFVPKASKALDDLKLLQSKGYVNGDKEHQFITTNAQVQIIWRLGPGASFDSKFISTVENAAGYLPTYFYNYYNSLWYASLKEFQKKLGSVRTMFGNTDIKFPVMTDSGHLMYYGHVIGGYKYNNHTVMDASAIKLILSVEYYIRANHLEQLARTEDYIYANWRDTVAISSAELRDENMEGDFNRALLYYIGTFVLMVCVACIMLWPANNNNIGHPMLLMFAQIASTMLALMFGFTTYSMSGRSLRFISNAFIPFAVFVMGMLRMFVQISMFACQDTSLETDEKIGHVMKSTGPAITLSFLLEVCIIATGIGPNFSGYRVDGLMQFSILAIICGVVGFVYQMTFIPACLALHDGRINSLWHCLLCKRIKPINKASKRSTLFLTLRRWFCDGFIPESRTDMESNVDKFLRYLLVKIIVFKVTKLITTIVFLVYVVVCIWSATTLRQTDTIPEVGARGSMYHTFAEWNKDFEDITYISFVVTNEMEYSSDINQKRISNLLNLAKQDHAIRDDFELNWLEAYKNNSYYNNTSEYGFVLNLNRFLSSSSGSYFSNDVITDYRINSARFHIVSQNLSDSKAKADLMGRMRDLAVNSDLDSVIAYSKDFILYEQYATLLPDYLMFASFPLCCFVIFLFIFHLVDLFSIIFLFISTVTFIACLFGGMTLLADHNVAFNFITVLPIRLMTTIALSMPVFVCVVYSQSKITDHRGRVLYTVENACVPIMKTCLCCVVGLLCLVHSSSYILRSLFAIFMIGAVNAIIHYAILLPVLLDMADTVFGHKKCPVVVSNKVHADINEKQEMNKVQY